ncbi:MAG: methionine--tRNA ligase [SAR202 cluster bacterium]|nr:methionine--tRNA ligase [SAR202 cluster bacterium]|tara:strand:+ start:15969 stop:17636 length:1668 start_codon:yes stop_codon:yes gene_type:complete
MTQRIFIGVAWPYANGPAHLGHLAGAYLPADVFARFNRIIGNEVLMVSGSDCHGAPITMRADAEGIQAVDVVEKFHQSFLDTWKRLGVSFDLFTTTMTDIHQKTTHELWESLWEKGYLYESSMKVAYSPSFDRFLPDRYVRGTCPHCEYTDARGDQCDNCGVILDPIDLKDLAYIRDGERYPVEIRDSNHIFLKLSAFQDQLLTWIEPNDFWRPNVRNFSKGILIEGLKDRAVTRNLDWGISVPIEGYEDRRIYVWFEAVIGYLSASIEWAQLSGDENAWRPFWQESSTRAYYFVGKDNIPFHTIIWPAMLMGNGDYILPYDVPANEFLNLEGRQLSTSRNWAVWAPDYLDRFDPDPLRYHLISNLPETGDSDFSWADYVRSNNDELVATFGNLVHRTLTQIYRNFDGKIPHPGRLSEEDTELIRKCEEIKEKVASSLQRVRLREALDIAMSLSREANRYLDQRAPWKQIKEDSLSAATTLYTAAYALMTLRVVMYPFVPFSAQKLHELLGQFGEIQDIGWVIEDIIPGTNIPKPEPLFIKLDDSVIEEMVSKLG